MYPIIPPSTCLHAYRFQVLLWSMLPCGPSQLRLRVRSSCKAEGQRNSVVKKKAILWGDSRGFCAGNSGFGARGVLEVETRRVWGARFRIWGLRSRVYGFGFMLGRAGRLSRPRGQPWSCRFLTQPPSTVKQLRVHEDGRAM